MVKPRVVLSSTLVQPNRPGGFEELVRAENISLQEGIGPHYRSVDVRFGGKVDQPGYRMLSQQAFCQSRRPNVTLHKPEALIGESRCQTGQVPRVGQGIKHDDRIVRMPLEPVVREVGANESRATRDQE